MNSTSREAIIRHKFNNNYDTVIPELRVNLRDAFCTGSPYFIAMYNHVQKKFFIGRTNSFESYIYSLYRMITGKCKIAIAKDLRTCYKLAEADHWTLEVYPATSTTIEEIHKLTKPKGWVELSANTSRDRNRPIEFDLHLYTDKKTGWSRYTTTKKDRPLSTAILGVRQALKSIRYADFRFRHSEKHRNVMAEYNGILKRTLNPDEYTFELITEIPEECHGYTGGTLARVLNTGSTDAWHQSDYYRNIPGVKK